MCVSADRDDGVGVAARTGVDGTYTLRRMAAGSYRVFFADCGNDNVASEWFDDTLDAAWAEPVTVIAGETTASVDATLAALGAIAGTVTGPGDVPLEGVCVSVSGEGADRSRRSPPPTAATRLLGCEAAATRSSSRTAATTTSPRSGSTTRPTPTQPTR